MKKLKSFRSYFKEYGALNPSHPLGGNSTGPGMGQYVPTADLNLRAQKKKNPRIPRKKGQPAGSDKHSDLYTDENPRGTKYKLQSQWNKEQKRWVRQLRLQSFVHTLKR